MSNSFLTPEALMNLTDRQLPSKQIAWLKDNGWKFAISAAGRPKVSQAYFYFRMGTALIEETDNGEQEPDFSRWTKKHGVKT